MISTAALTMGDSQAPGTSEPDRAPRKGAFCWRVDRGRESPARLCAKAHDKQPCRLNAVYEARYVIL